MPKATNKAVGTKFFKEGSQNQQILAKYWGNGKTFTTEELREKMNIASPGARLYDLKEKGFDVRVVDAVSNDFGAGRPVAQYKIMQRRAFA